MKDTPATKAGAIYIYAQEVQTGIDKAMREYYNKENENNRRKPHGSHSDL